MASKYWIKLYHEILDDPKMGRLRDRQWRRVIECFLLAGEQEDEGWLPPLEDMAWRLRVDAEALETELFELAGIGILEQREGRWFVSKFSKRQEAVKGAERMARLRERRKKRQYYDDGTPELPDGDEHVTYRHIDTDTDTEKNTNAPLVSEYCQIRKVPEPSLAHRTAGKYWLQPEAAMLEWVGGNEDKGRELVRATVAHMDANGLSHKNLASLVNVGHTVWKKMQQGNGPDPWKLIEAAWQAGDGRLVMGDPRTFAVVEKMGGWLRFKNAQQNDVPFLKREFMEVYNANGSA